MSEEFTINPECAHGPRPATAAEVVLWQENKRLKEENERLREVYEAARRVLRFNGVDMKRLAEAWEEMDAACERVKSLDSGLEDTFTLICPRCNVDRCKEPCPDNSHLCPMMGEAQSHNL